MGTVKRILRETANNGCRIYVRLRTTTVDVAYVTDFYVDKENWKNGYIRANSKTTKEYRDEVHGKLQMIEDAIPIALENLKNKGYAKINNKLFKEAVDKIVYNIPDEMCTVEDCWKKYMKAKHGDWEKHTEYLREDVYVNLKAYLESKGLDKVVVTAIKTEHIDGFFYYLKKECHIAKNTAINKMIIVKAFFNWLEKEKIITYNPAKEVTLEAPQFGTPFFLTWDEVKKVYAYNGRLTNAERLYKDVFVFQCSVGCRRSDLTQIKCIQIKKSGRHMWLEYTPLKTRNRSSKTVRVPLNDMAKAIYKKYMTDDGDAPLFQFNGSSYNDYLKVILEKAGIKRLVAVRDRHTGETVQERICDVASTHIARRTFIGNLYKKVKDPNIISSMSGHAEGSTAFNRYRAIDDDIKLDVINMLEE